MRTIGIDISSSNIEVAELRILFGNSQIRALSRSQLPPGVVEGDTFTDIPTLANHIKEAFASASPRPMKLGDVYIAVPESKVFTHVYTFPRSLDEEAVEKAIALQFSEYFPYEMDETVYDWYVVKHSEQTQTILVAACEKKYIDQLLELQKQLGLTYKAIGISSVSAARAVLPVMNSVDVAALIDMGSRTTSVSLFDIIGLQSTFTLHIGGDTLTEKIVKKLGVEFTQAENMRNEADMAGNEAHSVVEILQKECAPIVTDLQRSIRYIENTDRKKVQEVYIIGGMALQKGMQQFLSTQLGLPVHIGEPSRHVKLRAVPEGESPLFFTSAIGLTLRARKKHKKEQAINFLRKYQKDEK